MDFENSGLVSDFAITCSIYSKMWDEFNNSGYSLILVNATALGLAYPAARQMACTSCSVGTCISDLEPLTGTSADQLPHTKSRSLATA